MAFINEYISDSDQAKYNMTPENNFYGAGTYSWTVDKDRDMFLLWRRGPHPEGTPGVITWAFYWRSHLLSIELLTIKNGGDELTGHGWTHKKILGIDGITPELESRRAEIIENFREGLVANKSLGMNSTWKTYDVTLDTE